MVNNLVVVHRVPAGLAVPEAMQLAQEGLLARLDPENPPRVSHLQSVVNDETSAVLFALPGETSNVPWQDIPTEQYIGTLTLASLQTTTRYSGYIDHVVVDQEYEKQGVGELLVRNAILMGKLFGMSRLDLTSSASKIAAQKLYEKTGFQKRSTNNWRFEY